MKLILSTLFSLFSVCLCAQIKISEAPGPLDSSVTAEIQSADKGLLIPRMTTAQRNAIVSPTDGLTIYNTTTGAINLFRNGQWQPLLSFSGPVNRLYGGNGPEAGLTEELRHLVLTPDGGYVAVGTTSSSLFSGFTASPSTRQIPIAIKFDVNGNISWFREFRSISSAFRNVFDFVTTLPNGDLLITGNLRESVVLVRLNAAGNTVSVRKINGVIEPFQPTFFEYNNSVVFEKPETLLVGSSAIQTLNDYAGLQPRGLHDWVVFRMDFAGNIISKYRYGGSQSDFLGNILPVSDGNYLLAGVTWSPPSGDFVRPSRGFSDIILMKISASGDTLWTGRYGGAGSDYSEIGYNELGPPPQQFPILETADDGFLFACISNSSLSGEVTDTSRGDNDIWLVKINSQGAVVWNKLIGGQGLEHFPRLTATRDGNYLLAFSSPSSNTGDITFSSKGDDDCYLMKFDPEGNILWKRQYGGSMNDHVRSVAEKKDGTIILMAKTWSSNSGDVTGVNNGNADAWTLLLDANGRILQ